MATLLRIDEINKPFDSGSYMLDYFAVMMISQLRQEMRIKAAKDFREVILYIYELINTMQTYGEVDWNYVSEQFRSEYGQAVIEHSRDNQDVQNYIDEKTADFMRVTMANIENDQLIEADKRATMAAVNDANDVVGYEELEDAKDNGLKYKIWLTERDAFVRPTHRKMEKKKIPIQEMFHVGKGVMRYPHDWYFNPDECHNCRCALTFK